jgi:hypothetical protein
MASPARGLAPSMTPPVAPSMAPTVVPTVVPGAKRRVAPGLVLWMAALGNNDVENFFFQKKKPKIPSPNLFI